MAALCLLVACAGCTSEDPEAPAPSASVSSSSPTESSPPSPEAVARTLELRYRVKPRHDTLLQIGLPPQQPGGTMISWSAYFSGVGTVASPSDPLKVECYVVQATGPEFEDRVLYVADDSSSSTGFDVSISGSGLVDTEDGEQLTFECELNENAGPIPGLEWRTIPEQPIQVTLTPVEYERREVTVR